MNRMVKICRCELVKAGVEIQRTPTIGLGGVGEQIGENCQERCTDYYIPVIILSVSQSTGRRPEFYCTGVRKFTSYLTVS